MTQTADTRALLKATRRIARAFDVQSKRIDRALGLTLPQFVVLSRLAELGEVTSRAISAEADLSPPTVVGILDKLEAKRLIERYRSTRDRRIVHAHVTDAGRAALAAAPEPLGERFAARFSAMSAGERRAMLGALDRLADMLADGLEPAAELEGWPTAGIAEPSAPAGRRIG